MKRLSCLALVLALFGVIAGCEGSKNPVIVIKTSMGTIKAELYPDKAPGTVKNILQYVEAKHYDGTLFHRVIKDFMIQGGGFEKGLNAAKTAREIQAREKPAKARSKNEADNGLKNLRGTLAMARTGDPHSASAQFFINTVDNPRLDHKDKTPRGWGYTVFGKVTEGMDVVDKIRAVKTKALIEDEFEDVPVTEVVIESIRKE